MADEMISFRVGAEMLLALRKLAARTGVSVSDLLRASARRILQPRDELEIEPIGYGCEHVQLSGAGFVAARHGACRMRPVYRSATS